jgi:phospholipid/cholesterol/gamma-HCH transport system permease protein
MQIGHIILFFGRAIAGIPVVLKNYRKEYTRLLSDVAWGNGSLVVGGGTAGVAVVLGIVVGVMVGIEGYNFLQLLGLGPAVGIISSLVNTRELAPIACALAFSEEIDATEVMAIQPIPYMVTTRLMASITAIIPLYIVCLGVSYLSTQVIVSLISGGSMGGYMHYFGLMLNGQEIFYSVVKCVIFVAIAAVLQCYYGFYASGGPEGVGVAAGHAMRAAITVVVIVNMLLTMAMFSLDSGARFGG